MVEVHFTANLQRHVLAPSCEVSAKTVREALDAVFLANPSLRGYVVDESGALRQHMNVFVDGEQVADRVALRDEVSPNARLYVMQALSGG